MQSAGIASASGFVDESKSSKPRKGKVVEVSFRKTADGKLIATKRLEDTGGRWREPAEYVLDDSKAAGAFLSKCFK